MAPDVDVERRRSFGASPYGREVVFSKGQAALWRVSSTRARQHRAPRRTRRPGRAREDTRLPGASHRAQGPGDPGHPVPGTPQTEGAAEAAERSIFGTIGTVVMQAVGLYTRPTILFNPNSNLPCSGCPAIRAAFHVGARLVTASVD
jgi:hypothetical protein